MKKFLKSSLYFAVLLSIISILITWIQITFQVIGPISKNKSYKKDSPLKALQYKSKLKVAQIPLNGALMEGEDFTHGGISSIIKDLEDGFEEENISAILLTINSPGGSVEASKRVYDKVIEIRKTKPIVCLVTEIAASGAYYIASACDKIIVSKASLVGSIGVISMHLEIHRLLEKYGIKAEALKAGKFKDQGSPLRAMTPTERNLHQELLDEYYKLFKNDVAMGRKQKVSVVNNWAEGKIYTGEKAYKLKMVDALGGMPEALEELKKLLKTNNDLEIIEPERDLDYYLSKILVNAKSSKSKAEVDIFNLPILLIYPNLDFQKKLLSLFNRFN